MPAVIPIVAAVAGGLIAANGAESAANTQAAAAGNATQVQWNEYNQTRADQAPWRAAGGQAVNALSQWYGLGGVGNPMQPGAPSGSSSGSAGGGTGPNGQPAPPGYSWVPNAYGVPQLRPYGGPNSGPYVPTPQGGIQQQIAAPSGATSTPSGGQSTPDYNAILSGLPGYQFQLAQGQQAVERNLSAAGLLNSGAAGKALTQYGQGVASNYATQYVNGLQSLAGLGQTATQATSAAGANAANQIGGNYLYAGNAAATGAVGQANAINAGLQGIVSSYGQYTSQQPSYVSQGSQPYSPAANYGYDANASSSPWNYQNLGGP